MKQIDINSFLDFHYVSNPSFSPDGSWAAFVVQRACLEDNCYRGDLWLLDVGQKSVRPLTAGGDAKRYVWTPEGTLLFSALRDPRLKERTQGGEELTCWYEISPGGGEAVLAFTLPLTVTRLEPLDSDRYVVAAQFDNHRPDFSALPEGEREKAMKQWANPDWQVLDECPFWFNGEGFISGKRTRLYLYTRSSDTLTPLTSPWFQTSQFHIRQGKVLYQGVEWRELQRQELFDGLYLYDADTEYSRCLLPPGTIRTGAFALWSDHQALVAASDGARYGMGQYEEFYTLSLTDGTLERLADYEASIGFGSVGSDARLGGGRGLCAGSGCCHFITTLEDGSYVRSIDSSGVLSAPLTPPGSCDSFDLHGDNLLVCGLYGNQLPELYLNGVQVTHFNRDWTAAHTISSPVCHTVAASDGWDIHGWVIPPVHHVPGQRYPAILHIHGGPRTVFGPIYHHEMQVWANAGYFVLFCNPRGSDGRGNAFADLTGRYGTVDYDNVMEFTDRMLELYPDIDPARVGVTGGSYGGFLTNWIIGHTDRFAAAVSQRSISNWVSFEHTSDIGPTFTVNHQGTSTREDMDKLWWHSPLKYAPTCTTPTLFIHSDADYRCWMVEGLSMFTALKCSGCPTRLVLFRDESHELSRSGKPRSRIRRMEEILNWMNHYLG